MFHNVIMNITSIIIIIIIIISSSSSSREDIGTVSTTNFTKTISVTMETKYTESLRSRFYACSYYYCYCYYD